MVTGGEGATVVVGAGGGVDDSVAGAGVASIDVDGGEVVGEAVLAELGEASCPVCSVVESCPPHAVRNSAPAAAIATVTARVLVMGKQSGMLNY